MPDGGPGVCLIQPEFNIRHLKISHMAQEESVSWQHGRKTYEIGIAMHLLVRLGVCDRFVCAAHLVEVDIPFGSTSRASRFQLR